MAFSNIFLGFTLLCVTVCHAKIIAVNDNQLVALLNNTDADLHQLLIEDPSSVEKSQQLSLDKYPINNTNQLTHWTLAMMYKHTQESHVGCSPDGGPQSIIYMNLHTSFPLEREYTAFECLKQEIYEYKTYYFFGPQYHHQEHHWIPMSIAECQRLASSYRDPDNTPLTQFNATFFGTTRRPKTWYTWPITIYDRVTNYYLRIHPMKVNNKHLISIDERSPVAPCDIAMESCNLLTSVVVWGRRYKIFQPDPPCDHYHYYNQTCLIAKNMIRCPHLDLTITTVFRPYICGLSQGYLRLVVTNDRFDEELVNQNDHVALNTEFEELTDLNLLARSPTATLLGVQIDRCDP